MTGTMSDAQISAAIIFFIESPPMSDCAADVGDSIDVGRPRRDLIGGNPASSSRTTGARATERLRSAQRSQNLSVETALRRYQACIAFDKRFEAE